MNHMSGNGSNLDNHPYNDKATPNGLEAFETLGDFLEDDDWEPEEADAHYGYHMVYEGDEVDFNCYAQVRVDLEQFVFYAIAPVNAPLDKLAAVAEYLHRANFGLRVGNFELDCDTGQIRYKTAIDFEGETLTFGLLQNAIYPAVDMMEMYLGGLKAVMDGSMSPTEAINMAEAEPDDDDEDDDEFDAYDDEDDDFDDAG